MIMHISGMVLVDQNDYWLKDELLIPPIRSFTPDDNIACRRITILLLVPAYSQISRSLVSLQEPLPQAAQVLETFGTRPGTRNKW